MYYVIFGLLGAALLGADQWVKAWVMGHLQMGETTSLFPGLTNISPKSSIEPTVFNAFSSVLF